MNARRDKKIVAGIKTPTTTDTPAIVPALSPVNEIMRMLLKSVLPTTLRTYCSLIHPFVVILSMPSGVHFSVFFDLRH